MEGQEWVGRGSLVPSLHMNYLRIFFIQMPASILGTDFLGQDRSPTSELAKGFLLSLKCKALCSIPGMAKNNVVREKSGTLEPRLFFPSVEERGQLGKRGL